MSAQSSPPVRHHGAPKHGDALLPVLSGASSAAASSHSGTPGMKHHHPALQLQPRLDGKRCPHFIAFGGLRVDDAIEKHCLASSSGLSPPQTAAPQEVGEGGGIRCSMLSGRDLEAAR